MKDQERQRDLPQVALGVVLVAHPYKGAMLLFGVTTLHLHESSGHSGCECRLELKTVGFQRFCLRVWQPWPVPLALAGA